VDDCAALWPNLHDAELRAHVAVEEHYLTFHRRLLGSLQANMGLEQGFQPIDWSLRAGMIRASVILFGSIAEAVLLDHAAARQMQHPRKGRVTLAGRWTLGTLTNVWATAGSAEYDQIRADVESLRDMRNNIHLSRAVADRHRWQDVIAAEEALVEAGDRVIAALRTFV